MSTFRAHGRRERESRDHSAHTERQPVDVLAHQMNLARWARQSQQWAEYEKARDVAIHLVLGHRVEDEVSRFRQVMTACTGWQDQGQDARELIERRLADAFLRGIEGPESAHALIVRMQRIPRAAATAALVSDMRRGDGELCINALLSEDGHIVEDIQAVFGDDPARIAARLTPRDWADFAAPLMAISPGELRQDMLAEARKSMRRALSAIGSH